MAMASGRRIPFDALNKGKQPRNGIGVGAAGLHARGRAPTSLPGSTSTTASTKSDTSRSIGVAHDRRTGSRSGSSIRLQYHVVPTRYIGRDRPERVDPGSSEPPLSALRFSGRARRHRRAGGGGELDADVACCCATNIREFGGRQCNAGSINIVPSGGRVSFSVGPLRNGSPCGHRPAGRRVDVSPRGGGAQLGASERAGPSPQLEYRPRDSYKSTGRTAVLRV